MSEPMIEVHINYTVVVLPVKQGLEMVRLLLESGGYFYDSAWGSTMKTSINICKPLAPVVTTKGVDEEDLAMRKLEYHAMRQREQEKKANDIPF